MPEWLQGVLAAAGAAIGAWAAIRVELRFVWRDIAALTTRVLAIENGETPRRRWSDQPRGVRVRRE